MTTARVKVGYEYSGCDKSVWHIQTAKLSGHDMANTDIGGWNLHVQHKYNFHSGILQKGDGNTVYLKYKPQVQSDCIVGIPQAIIYLSRLITLDTIQVSLETH